MMQHPSHYSTLVLLLLIVTLQCEAWSTHQATTLLPTFSRRSLLSSTRLQASLSGNYKEFGEETIRRVAVECGADASSLSIEWKAGRIVVTVHGPVYVSTVRSDDEEVIEESEDADDDLESEDEEEEEEEEEDRSAVTAPATDMGVDMTALARAINAAFDDGDGLGSAIAEIHEIEVTTPGASQELSGIMFKSYRGFDVICQQQDPKTQKIKEIVGRLVERNDEFTIMNIKGRIKKMKNETVLSVRLPKVKKEKN